MLLNNLSGKLFYAAVAIVAGSVVFDYKWNVLPFGGLYILVLILFLLSITIWIMCIIIQTILKENKPIVYNFNNNNLEYVKKVYAFLYEKHKDDIKNTTGKANVEYKNIDERIDDFTKDVETIIEKWFLLISTDQLFLKETRNLVDDLVRRFLQVIIEVDSKQFLHGILVIFLNHVKEYRKTIKRQKKNSGSVEDLYRYMHIASMNEKAFEHTIFQLTSKVLRQFITWEVYSSVPGKCVSSILARKLTTYLLIFMSKPSIINYKIANLCSSVERKNSLKLHEFDAVSLIDVNLSITIKSDAATTFEIAEKAHNTKDLKRRESSTPRMSPKCDISKQIEEEETKDENTQEVTEVDSSRIVSAPVKIYESCSSNKTWRNSGDLECISLGQDLLVLEEYNDPDSQIQNLIEKKLWKDNSDSLEAEERQSVTTTSNQTSLEEPLDLAKDLMANIPSPNIPSFISNTIKPIGNATATTFQELQQSTVNNVVKPVSQATSSAMHKFGDLQDEAAGVMEGIFDFGMAGLRKGLRLTGLQDGPNNKIKETRSKTIPDGRTLERNLTEISPTKTNLDRELKIKSKLAKVGPVTSEETVWVNPLTKDTPNFDGQILLERSIPTISMNESHSSPDPEYEDTTDLAATTAKLRCLLQQRTSDSNLTTPAVSPMPFDETGKSFSTPSEFASTEDITGVDGALPSLYKFCARTATGVFQNTLNTLKTALPGNAEDNTRQDLMRCNDTENWTYVASDVGEDHLTVRIEKLLSDRQPFCIVENAYEAVESLDLLDQPGTGWSTPTRKYDDDLEELELNIPLTKTLLDIFCELTADTNTFLTQETVVKALLISFGSVSEDYMETFASRTIKNVNRYVGKLPSTTEKKPLALSLESFVEMCLDIVPGYLKWIIGDEIFYSATRTLLSSIQCQRINEDVTLQIFELLTRLLIEASSKVSPTYSA